jgi:hypothetical protein
MALDDVVKNAFAGISTDASLGQQVYNAIINSISDTLQATAKHVDTQLDPRINKSLKYTIEGFNVNSARENINPSQLYSDMANIYRQNIFGNGSFSNILLLSALYMRALKKLGYPDPITGKREIATRQERESAQNIANIIGGLLANSLYQYYQSIGKNVTESEIMTNLDKYTSVLYGAYSGVINQIGSYIIFKTPNISLLESSTRLITTLDGVYMSSIEGLISAMYSRLPIPEAVSPILNALGQKGFYNSIFDEIYRKIGYYISQGLQPINKPNVQQPPQQAGQQLAPQPGGQQGQQGNQSNVQQPPQPPASQQSPSQQQQAPQGGQLANQFRQPPGPYVLRP